MCPAVPMTRFSIERLFALLQPHAGVFAEPLLPPFAALFGRLLALFLFRPSGTALRSTGALAAPDLFEDVFEAEIDLPAFHVDADDLHAHLIAEPVGLLRV